MSRAFVKEADSDTPEELPERPISAHPNFVTARGLHLIDTTLQQLESDREAAKAADDTSALARINRDLRYWQQRKASAQLVAIDAAPSKVRFGMTVTLKVADGSERRFTLVGEDEADPAHGLISFASPVAQSLLGHEVGDEVDLHGVSAEIIAIAGAHS
jgi:transcription elongation GreA/GreB family factor